jgi:hypothetical protein
MVDWKVKKTSLYRVIDAPYVATASRPDILSHFYQYAFDSRMDCHFHLVCEDQQEAMCGKSEGIEFDALSKPDQSSGTTKLVKSRLPY